MMKRVIGLAFFISFSFAIISCVTLGSVDIPLSGQTYNGKTYNKHEKYYYFYYNRLFSDYILVYFMHDAKTGKEYIYYYDDKHSSRITKVVIKDNQLDRIFSEKEVNDRKSKNIGQPRIETITTYFRYLKNDTGYPIKVIISQDGASDYALTINPKSLIRIETGIDPNKSEISIIASYMGKILHTYMLKEPVEYYSNVGTLYGTVIHIEGSL